MASKMFFVFIFTILQCGLVFSSSLLLKSLNYQVNNSPIPLSKLISELQSQAPDTAAAHYILMVMVHSYGGRIYDLSKNLSIECSRTIRASMLTIENLAVSEEAIVRTTFELKAATQDVRNAKQLEEHPAELYCSRIEKSFGANPELSIAFEKAKKEAAKFDFTSRPPYARMILKAGDTILFKILELFAVPEFARLIAMASFAEQTNTTNAHSWRTHYFVKSCLAVGKSEKFTNSIQSLYGKVLEETIPEITADDRAGRFFTEISHSGLYWVPKMTKTFYDYIASDENLKKELEKMAAIVGNDASKENLDFSKL